MEDGNGKVRPLARPPGCNKATTVGWPLCSSSPKVTQREPKMARGGRTAGRKTLVCSGSSRPLFARPPPELEELQQMRGKNPPDARTDRGSGLGFGLRGLAKKNRAHTAEEIRSCREDTDNIKRVSNLRLKEVMPQGFYLHLSGANYDLLSHSEHLSPQKFEVPTG